MRNDIIDFLKDEIYCRCQKAENKFGIGCYYHIEAVVKNAEILSKRYDANPEIVIIAAWLHDIASITDYSLYELHHMHGAEMAYEILIRFHYDEHKILLVQDCIRNHRGSVNTNKRTIEELCVADADAISHFDNVPSLLHLAYVTKAMSMEDGKVFVRKKLERSFHKLSNESKIFYKDKYLSVINILS